MACDGSYCPAEPSATEIALGHLCAASPQLAGVIERVGAYQPAMTRDPFVALVGSVVHQQVSMSAAAAILKRVRACCPGRRLTPAAILGLPRTALRRAGCSRQKVATLRELAGAFVTRRLTRAGLRRLPDEEVFRLTTQVKGVGRWTAEMLLIFCLGRPDVWPAADFGLRKAAQKLLGQAAMPSVEEMRALAEPWRPYRTYAAWYLWRSLDGPVAPRIA